MKKALKIIGFLAAGGISVYLINKFYTKKLQNIKKQLYDKYTPCQNINQQNKQKIQILGKFTGLISAPFIENVEIVIGCLPELKEKLEKMRKDGLDQLQIISDFDWTITSFAINNQKTPTIYGLFNNSPLVSEKGKNLWKLLFDKYHPIEIDPHMTFEEKNEKMFEWYDLSKNVFLEENLDKKKLLEILNTSNMGVRYGFDRMLYLCKRLNLPFYIISGGLTQIINTVLQRQANILNYPNFFIFGNDLRFNAWDQLVDIESKVLATTKNQILDPAKFQFKKNTLIFGDLFTDYEMGAQVGENKIAIAFLEPSKRYLLNTYLEKFDIVLIGDGNFVLHDYLIRYIGKLNENYEFIEKMSSCEELIKLKEKLNSDGKLPMNKNLSIGQFEFS